MAPYGDDMLFPLAVLLLVFLLIAARQFIRVPIRIWQIVLAGAVLVLLGGQITVQAALAAINFDVIFLLVGMFVIAVALEESGYLVRLSIGIFKSAGSTDALVVYMLFGIGIVSMLVVNDALAVVGTPIALLLARRLRLPPSLMLLTLAFAITIGSVASPIGNPQNFLIAASSGVKSPFIAFPAALLIPTILNLVLTYAVLRIFYGKSFRRTSLRAVKYSEPYDKGLATLTKLSLALLLALILLDIVSPILFPSVPFRLSYIAAAALPVLAFSPRRAEIFKKVEWGTIVFFISLFVLTGSVFGSGFFQSVLYGNGIDISSIPVILVLSTVISQFISNVPLAIMYLHILQLSGAGQAAYLALAAGSTIAGNLLVLGAASNVIIVQAAEKRGYSLTFTEFAKVGIVLTAINILVYAAFLSFA